MDDGNVGGTKCLEIEEDIPVGRQSPQHTEQINTLNVRKEDEIPPTSSYFKV
jgi:hypothetical protein